MYRRCTFCASDLGTNEVVEAFPVGRRLAFDVERGRLWVICRVCERWNLTPLEERWEAVEDSERIFRETPLRASTEQIGLARHREGLELVRVGAPPRTEFAAWRYGDQFGKRRRRFIRNGVVGVGLAGGVILGSAGILGSVLVLQAGVNALSAARWVRHVMTPELRVPLSSGETLRLNPTDVGSSKLRPGGAASPFGEADPGAPWHLSLDSRDGPRILTGEDAVTTLRTILPRVNFSGAKKSTVADAVRELEEVGGPEAYFARAEHRARKVGWGYMNLPGLPHPIRLALEMAAHEDSERAALQGELAWLERAWREAEEIAAIADDLTLPDRVRIRLAELKERYAAKRRAPGRPGGPTTPRDPQPTDPDADLPVHDDPPKRRTLPGQPDFSTTREI